LDPGGGAADQAGELQVEQGGVQGGWWEVRGGRQATRGQQLAVDQGGQDGSGGRVEAGPGVGALAAIATIGIAARAADGTGGGTADWTDGGAGSGADAGRGAELLEDVGEAADQGGAVADELVAAGGAGVPGGSGEDEDVAGAAAAGGAGGGEAAGVLGGLDHDHGGGQGGDEAVAGEEVGGAGLGRGRVLADQGAAGGPDPGEQAAVGAGIGDVQATAQHDHRPASGVQGAGVGGGVDAHGPAADHAPAGPGQPGPDGAGGGAPQRRGAATPHHRDRRRRPGWGRAVHEQPGARRVGRGGGQRPALVARSQQPHPELVEPPGHRPRVGAVRPEQARRVPSLSQPGRHRRRHRPRRGRQRQQHRPLPHPGAPPRRPPLRAPHLRPRGSAAVGALIRAGPRGRR